MPAKTFPAPGAARTRLLCLALALFSLAATRAQEAPSSSNATRRRHGPLAAANASGPQVAAPPATAVHASPAPSIPPAPEGVTDLKFNEMFKPVGPRGLEYTDKLRALDGKRVRLLGHMVKQSRPMPWTLLLAPVPLSLHESEYGFAEDMPATVVHVFTQRNASPIVPFTPGLVLLTGTLSVGNRQEPDGRVSSVRLNLDPPDAGQRAAPARFAGSPHPISTNSAMVIR